MKTWLLAIVVLVVLDFIYLMPGSQALLSGRTDAVMSDDTDPAALPYIYDQVIQIFKNNPARLFYGSVYIEPTDPERGFPAWMSWSERWTVLAAAPFFKLEQLSTAVVFVFLLLNGLAMYALARQLRWSPWIALGLATAWAFNPFTRARAKVHMAMAGTFHLPLIFLALILVARGRGRKSLALAAAALLIACSTVHYFIVTSLFLSPFFLIFFALQPEVRANWKRGALRLAVAAAPAVLFLGLNFAFPVPGDAKVSSQGAMPKSGETWDGSQHPFLTIYAAHPIDYLAGDVALDNTGHDLNPLREKINTSIINDLQGSNTHERSNGIRWSVLILAALALWSYKKSSNRSWLGFFAAFALVGFWLSLPADFPFTHLGASGWLNKLVTQVRVPSRAGIMVHFSLLMLAGEWLSTRAKSHWLLLPAVLPLLLLADYPPLVQPMPMAAIRPSFTELQRENGPCGAGILFPFANNYQVNVLYYWFLQQMRGSDCQILNGMQNVERLVAPAQAFPVTMEFLSGLEHDLVTPDRLSRMAACVPLNWIAFDPHVPKPWREQMCTRLGWRLSPDLVCVSPEKGRALKQLPDRCL